MADSKKIHVSHEFIEELINRFFHPRSYFYHTISNSLKAEISKSGTNPSALKLLDELLDYLIDSKKPLYDLMEISQMHGFENIYRGLEAQLNQIDFSGLNRADTKNFIKKLALSTFAVWLDILSHDKQQTLLKSYLKLKKRLKMLLSDSNGSDTYLDKDNLSSIKIDNQESGLIDQTSILAEEVLADQKKEKIAFQKFFKKEIRDALSSIEDDFSKAKEQNSDEELFDKFYDIFYKLNELAKFHEYVSVAQICEKIMQILEVNHKQNLPWNPVYYQFIIDGKNTILKLFDQSPSKNEVNEFLKKCNLYLKKQNNHQVTSSNVPIPKNDSEPLSPDRYVEYNTLEHKTLPNENFRSDSPANDNRNGSAPNSRPINDRLQFSLPGEENEDLLNLIKDISITMSLATSNDSKVNARDVEEFIPSTDYPEKNSSESQSKIIEAYATFSKEAKLFIQIILDSLAKLKNNESVDTALIEEIELACSSLKHLSRKMGLEKIAFLPELIESICINVYAADLKLPPTVLKTIEDGVLLLQHLNIENKKNETTLIAILSSLKEYYAYTLKAIEKTQMASS